MGVNQMFSIRMIIIRTTSRAVFGVLSSLNGQDISDFGHLVPFSEFATLQFLVALTVLTVLLVLYHCLPVRRRRRRQCQEEYDH